MRNFILNFIRDERGAESVEFGITGIVIGAGAVAGMEDLQDTLNEKNADMLDKLGEAGY